MKISELTASQPTIFPVRVTRPRLFKACASLSNLRNLHVFSGDTRYHPLKKAIPIDNIFQELNKKPISFKKKLNFKWNDRPESISATHYVYLGSLLKTALPQTGLTLDDDGNLLFIKGRRADLFCGMYKKYFHKHRQLICKLPLKHAVDTFQFTGLFINNAGQLIGIEKKVGTPYIIHFECVKKKSPDALNVIHIALYYAPIEKDIQHNLTFPYCQSGKTMTASFSIEHGKLYVVHSPNGQDGVTPCESKCEVDLPLKSNWQIHSIKKTVNVLQLEIRYDSSRKTRIAYLDPVYFLKKDEIAWLSHKPPQNFINGLGNDPHESYFSGQPFSSTRRGNFSSQHIPLVSSVIDKFRLALKQAKPHYFRKETLPFLLHLSRGIDPGIGYVVHKAYQHGKRRQRQPHDRKPQERIYHEHKRHFLQNYNLFKNTLIECSGFLTHQVNLSSAISHLFTQLNEGDTVAFQSIDELGFFFGVAAGGVPFAPGWFAGIVAMFKNEYDIAITKKTDGFDFEFTHQSDKTCVFLAGTGQGLEDNAKIVKTSYLDLVTLLPLEANLIFITHILTGSSFCFHLTEANMIPFIETLTQKKSDSLFKMAIIEENQINLYKEHTIIIQLETKSELRAELGYMANNHTYLLLPRTALGIRLALQCLRFHRRSEHSLSHTGATSLPTTMTFSLLTGMEADFFEEAKIMPIALKSGYMNTDNVWCFPLPLPEEYHALIPYQKSLNVLSFTNQSPAYEAPRYFHIDKEKLPEVLRGIVGDLYRLFYDNSANDINYHCEVPPHLAKIALFATTSRLGNPKDETQENHGARSLEQLQKEHSDLAEMIDTIDWLVANSQRHSLYKRSTIRMRCKYTLLQSEFDKLKCLFYDTLHTIELKSKNNGILCVPDVFDCEINMLKQIKAVLSNKDQKHGRYFALQHIGITRHSYAEKRIETLQFAIFRARQTARVTLIQPIGHLELNCDREGKRFEVTQCQLNEQ